MASLDLDDNRAAYQIRSFKPGSIRINDQTLTKSVIITPTRLIEDWQPQTAEALSADHLASIIPLKPDILLIGTGSAMVILSPDVYGELINAGIGVEVMDTSAACRTYNALSSENRKVVAALIIR